MLVATRTVLAGEQLVDTDFRVVSISTEDDLATISASNRNVLVGQYARVRIEAGVVVTPGALQTDPLVSPDRVLMSVLVPAGEVPRGLREQSRVALVGGSRLRWRTSARRGDDRVRAVGPAVPAF